MNSKGQEAELVHQAAFEFVQQCLEKLPLRTSVVEYGSRFINGTVRPLFGDAAYIGLDQLFGDGVDLVEDACIYEPPQLVDTVVCCGVLEHSEKWPDLIKSAGRILDPKTGVLILTTVCNPWPAHSVLDGGALRFGEYYKNMDPLEVTAVLDVAGFEQHESDLQERTGDFFVLARRQADL